MFNKRVLFLLVAIATVVSYVSCTKKDPKKVVIEEPDPICRPSTLTSSSTLRASYSGTGELLSLIDDDENYNYQFSYHEDTLLMLGNYDTIGYVLFNADGFPVFSSNWSNSIVSEIDHTAPGELFTFSLSQVVDTGLTMRLEVYNTVYENGDLVSFTYDVLRNSELFYSRRYTMAYDTSKPYVPYDPVALLRMLHFRGYADMTSFEPQYFSDHLLTTLTIGEPFNTTRTYSYQLDSLGRVVQLETYSESSYLKSDTISVQYQCF